MSGRLAHATPVEEAGKWVRREPEMELALRFVPAPQRPAFIHWGALVAELREALFELSDARVIAAKAGWWGEELLRFSQGEYRHPLGERLPPDLPWLPLAQAVAGLLAGPDRPEHETQALEQVTPLARAFAEVEAAWFGAPEGSAASRAWCVHLLAQRLHHGRGSEDAARIPMNRFARHGLVADDLRQARGEPLVRDWAAHLLDIAPRPRDAGVLYRRLRLQMDLDQLAHLGARPAAGWHPGLGSAWRCWRVARQALR